MLRPRGEWRQSVHSLLGGGHTANGQQIVELADGAGVVPNVHGGSLALTAALALEGPGKADGVVALLGDLRVVVALHHGLDGGVAGPTEARHEGSIGMGVRSTNGFRGRTGAPWAVVVNGRGRLRF